MNNRFRADTRCGRGIELSDTGIVKSMNFLPTASIAESV
jgi:hypothetical protein